MSSATADSAAVAAPPSERLFSFSAPEFDAQFARKPFLIEHRLCEHPLFDLSRILELARALPEDRIEYNAGDLPVNQDQSRTPRNGLSVEETVRRIAECRSWMVLKHVERDPEYKALLEQCLSEIRPHTEKIAPGMMLPHAYIFVTSPGSVTPYHIDPEHNFLLQIKGSKTIRMFDGRDRSILSETDLERFYGERVRNLTISEENLERCWTFELTPGHGLHFPVTYPHWVKNGGDVSVSFSITFRTPDLDRRRLTHAFNGKLRKWGVTPTPVGRKPWLDHLKYQGFRVAQKVHSLFSRNER